MIILNNIQINNPKENINYKFDYINIKIFFTIKILKRKYKPQRERKYFYTYNR